MCEIYGKIYQSYLFFRNYVRYPYKILEVKRLRLTSFAPNIPPREACWESSDPDFPVQSGKELANSPKLTSVRSFLGRESIVHLPPWVIWPFEAVRWEKIRIRISMSAAIRGWESKHINVESEGPLWLWRDLRACSNPLLPTPAKVKCWENNPILTEFRCQIEHVLLCRHEIAFMKSFYQPQDILQVSIPHTHIRTNL